MTPRIRIVAVPPGEAPQWVREKWVGVELPLALRSPRSHRFHVFGVLTGPRGLLAALWRVLTGRSERKRGYAVEVGAAVAALERANPDAAAWWRTNASHLFERRSFFVFQERDCQVVPEPSGVSYHRDHQER